MEVILNTGRTVDQGVSMERGKTSPEYFEKVAVVFLHPEDANTLGVKEGEAVRVTTEFGSVVVRCLFGNTEKGMIFMPMGPWANFLTSPLTGGTGMPSLKGLRAKIAVAPGQEPTTLEELVRRWRGEGGVA
ncbi:MAG: molybdopterin dinucleotide binding domain-containing protein [Candidatus Hadarchaeales archaeon]